MRKPKVLTERQMTITKLIARKKEDGCDSITLDEIIDELYEKGVIVGKREDERPGLRPAVLITMKGLVKRLNDSGVKIEQLKKVGRGAKTVFTI